ncbi:MAG: hypothetical protein DI585_02125 [Pseudomonas fluorescens]|nr:MAG: hypothetical protein DI585_02125 [Pseudomonas fluorescens]
MDEFIVFIKDAMEIKKVSESTELNVICPGGINQGMLCGRINNRYGVNLTNTQLMSCQTVGGLHHKINVKQQQKQQAINDGRCTVSLQRERMIGLH